MEKFTFCPISGKGHEVFSKEWWKMWSPPSLKVNFPIYFVNYLRGSTVTDHQKGTGPYSTSLAYEDPYCSVRLLGCRVDPGYSCSLKVFVVVFQLWFLTWTALSLQCRFFSAPVWIGYSRLPMALCLMDHKSSGSVLPGSLAGIACKGMAAANCLCSSQYTRSPRGAWEKWTLKFCLHLLPTRYFLSPDSMQSFLFILCVVMLLWSLSRLDELSRWALEANAELNSIYWLYNLGQVTFLFHLASVFWIFVCARHYSKYWRYNCGQVNML